MKLRIVIAWLWDSLMYLTGYTGCHTVNGEPIFEGDRVRHAYHPDLNARGVVVWDVGKGTWVCRCPHNRHPSPLVLVDRQYNFDPEEHEC